MGWRNLRSMQVSVLIVILSVVSAVGGGGAADAAEESSLIRSNLEVRLLFLGWKEEHGKSYKDPEEEAKRFEIFRNSLRYIDERNHPKNNHSFTLGLTSFADLTHEEFLSTYTGGFVSSRDPLDLISDDLSSDPSTELDPPPLGLNESFGVDWREMGAMGPVKHQLACNSCWAFTAVATVEAMHAIMTRSEVITLSEQEIVDCDDLGTHCNPGWMQKAYNYIVRNDGINTDESYPYIGVQSTCMATNEKFGRISGYLNIRPYREDIMMSHVARQPIGVAVDSREMDFQHYIGGVFDGSCGITPDHAVTIAGFGTDRGKDYWLIKNSWGTGWGEEGYLRLRRNTGYRGGKCGVAMYPIMPRRPTHLEESI